MGRKRSESVVRRALHWYFERSSPWVNYSVSIDFTGASEYLLELRSTLPEVTVNHLLAAAVGRALGEFPKANARIVGSRPMRVEDVAVAMPVHLLGQPGEKRELSLSILEEAQRKSLREITEELSGAVHRERRGEGVNPWLGWIMNLGDRLPDPVFDGTLTLLSLLMEVPAFASAFYSKIPVTTFLTNVGSVVKTGREDLPITLVRGGAFQLPLRPIHFTTFWGVGPVQDEVVAREGQVVVRPMLPIVLLFDHRVLDGALAGDLLFRFASLIKEPSKAFGPTGDTK